MPVLCKGDIDLTAFNGGFGSPKSRLQIAWIKKINFYIVLILILYLTIVSVDLKKNLQKLRCNILVKRVQTSPQIILYLAIEKYPSIYYPIHERQCPRKARPCFTPRHGHSVLNRVVWFDTVINNNNIVKDACNCRCSIYITANLFSSMQLRVMQLIFFI